MSGKRGHGLLALLCWLGALAWTPAQAESDLPLFAQVFRDQGVVMLLIVLVLPPGSTVPLS